MPINSPGNNLETDYFANMPQSQRQASQNMKRKAYQFDPEQLAFKKGPADNTA